MDYKETLTRPALVAAVFLALHVLPLLWRPNPLWGADLLFYHAPLYRGIFILLAVLLFIPAIRSRVQGIARTLPLSPWESGRSAWLIKALVLLIALAVFVALRSACHLLGDGYLLLRDLDAGILQPTHRAPFTFVLVRFLHSTGGPLWETAENTYRTYSYVSGAIYVLIAFPVAGTLGKTPLKKSIVLAFLLTGGFLQLFSGYVENYALYMPGILLYLLLGMRVLENRMSIYVPALLLSLLVNLHLALALFSPSLLMLVYRNYCNKRGLGPRWRNWLSTATAVCVVPLGAALFLWLSGVEFLAYLGRAGDSHLLPVLAQPDFRDPYRLFSLSHLLDFLNLQLLAAPAACMALFLLGKRSFGHHPFLLSAAAFPLLFTFLANPEIGAFRDWDILALPALPLTLWAASALLSRMRDPNSAFQAAFLICGAAALHSLMWIGLNASPTAAETRYAHLMDRLTGHAASYGWETLGSYYHLQDNPGSALNAYQRALDANPDNPRHWLAVGYSRYIMGQYEESIRFFRRAVEINPNLPKAHLNLGMAYRALKRMEEARSSLARVLELDPDNPQAERIRRFLAKHRK